MLSQEEYKKAVQLLLSDEGNNYIVGIYILLEHKSLEHICDLIMNKFKGKYYYYPISFGNFRISGYYGLRMVCTYPLDNSKDCYETKVNKNKEQYENALMRKEIHKHLIRIFDFLI